MEDCLPQAIMIVIAIAFVVALIFYALAAVYCLLAFLCYLLLGLLDMLFASGLGSTPPPVMWAVCGALIGGALGVWTVAPVYGWRKQRPLIVAAPIVMILLLAGIAGATRRPSAYTTPSYGASFGSGNSNFSPATNTSVSTAPVPGPLSASSLMGSWIGKFGKSQRCVLDVYEIKGNHFSGVARLRYSDGEVKLAISGELGVDRKSVSFQEERVLQQPVGRNWKLGTDTGQLANPDRLVGSGRDSGNNNYSWSFLRATRGVGTESSANKAAARAMIGTWTGTCSNRATSLVIDKVTDNMLHGTFNQGATSLKISGEISGNGDIITFRETQMITGNSWTLGYYTGKLSAQHHQISGSGTDGINAPYTWTFTK